MYNCFLKHFTCSKDAEFDGDSFFLYYIVRDYAFKKKVLAKTFNISFFFEKKNPWNYSLKHSTCSTNTESKEDSFFVLDCKKLCIEFFFRSNKNCISVP